MVKTHEKGKRNKHFRFPNAVKEVEREGKTVTQCCTLTEIRESPYQRWRLFIKYTLIRLMTDIWKGTLGAVWFLQNLSDSLGALLCLAGHWDPLGPLLEREGQGVAPAVQAVLLWAPATGLPTPAAPRYLPAQRPVGREASVSQAHQRGWTPAGVQGGQDCEFGTGVTWKIKRRGTGRNTWDRLLKNVTTTFNVILQMQYDGTLQIHWLLVKVTCSIQR